MKQSKKLELRSDDGFGVSSPKSIPYEPMLPILASLLRELEINFKPNQVDCYDKIQRWYWVSIFGKRFSDSVDAKKTSDYKDMVEWFKDDDKAPEFITDFETQFGSIILAREARGAIYDGMLCILAKRGAQDLEIRVTTNKKTPHKDHIFPKSQIKEAREKNSILNMTWLTEETNTKTKKARMPSKYIKQLMEEKYGNDKTRFLEVLESHLINEEGLNALLEDDFEEFIRSRDKEMKKEIAIRTGTNYAEEINYPTQTSLETPASNLAALMWSYEKCEKEFILNSLYLSNGDLKLILASAPELKVKKIRLLTSVKVYNKTLKEFFIKVRDEIGRCTTKLNAK